MTHGYESRLKFAQRGLKETNMGWLRHKFYLFRLWTGAYMLDHWEQIIVLVLFLALLLIGYNYIILQHSPFPSTTSDNVKASAMGNIHNDNAHSGNINEAHKAVKG